MRNYSVHIHFVHATLAHARERNIDIHALLARARISPALVRLGDVRVSARQYADLQTLTMLAMDDELVGHTPHPVPIGSWPAMCHWLVNTRNLKQALKRFCRFHELLGKGFQPALEVKENTAILHVGLRSDPGDYGVYGYELFLFACHRLLCWLTRERIPIRRMHFPFPKPSHYREYAHLFHGYPVYFDRENCTLSFHKSVLNLPVRQNLESLNLLLRDPL